jgi:DNA repair protein RecN (Recombination protein N)
MLNRITISNFVLIDNLDLDIKSGLTVLTGETGSGKSIIIDAIMLIFGTRITTDVIRSNQTTANLVAEFELSNPNAITWLTDNDLHDHDDDKNLICRRVIDINGKNKIYINGHTVTASQIKILGELILDIHTQHAAITLLKAESQRLLLDEYAGISDNVNNLTNQYKKIFVLSNKINDIKNNQEKLLIRQQEIEEAISELSALNLQPNQWLEIETRHKQISNLSVVLEELNSIQNLINQDEYSLSRMINQINSRLHKISNYVANSNKLLEITNSMEIEINELDHDLNIILKSIEVEPNELETLEDRMQNIFILSRKYKTTPNEIPEFLIHLQNELNSIADNQDLEVLDQELEELKTNYNKAASVVTKSRINAANELSHKVTKLLHNLAIRGEFKVLLTTLSSPTPYGLENIEFNVAFNQGMSLQALAKVASGGELSRTALSLYLLLSIKNSPETIIFDEIDVGIGGGIASQIGKMLQTLGHNKQVICITHQAQTASFGNNHLVISKDHSNNQTTLQATYLNPKNRVEEIARMIGGVKITETTINHAREMLEQI